MKNLQLLISVKKYIMRSGKTLLVVFMVATIVINIMLLTAMFNTLTGSIWLPVRARVQSADGVIHRARWKWYLNITYHYSVNKRRYTGGQISFMDHFYGCPMKKLERAAVYRPHDIIQVYYFPLLPQFSVIFRDTSFAERIGYFIALPVVWLGSLFTFLPGWIILRGAFRASAGSAYTGQPGPESASSSMDTDPDRFHHGYIDGKSRG